MFRMNKNAIWAAVPLLLLCGCDDEPSGQRAGSLGEPELSRERVGVGQPLEVTVAETEPPVGTVTNRSMTWRLNGISLVSDGNRYADGVYARTVYPDEAGTNTLELNVDYVYKVAGSDGRQIRSAVASVSFDAEPCDVRTSFWGDAPGEVVYNEYLCPLEEQPDGTYAGHYTPVYAKPLYLRYSFTDGGLSSADEKQYNELSPLGDYALFVTSFIAFKDSMDAWYNEGALGELSAEWTELSDKERAAWESFKEDYDTGNRKTLSVDDERLIGAAMADGRLSLRACYRTGTRTLMDLYTEPAEVTSAVAVFFVRSYTENLMK